MPPGPSSPASRPTARNTSSNGAPMRKEIRLVNVETAINPAPIRIARFIASNIGVGLPLRQVYPAKGHRSFAPRRQPTRDPMERPRPRPIAGFARARSFGSRRRRARPELTLDEPIGCDGAVQSFNLPGHMTSGGLGLAFRGLFSIA